MVAVLQKPEFYCSKDSFKDERNNYIQKRPFLAYNGFIVGCWSSIVQTSQFENKKNRETKGKIQVLSFRTISYIPVRGRCRETQSQL